MPLQLSEGFGIEALNVDDRASVLTCAPSGRLGHLAIAHTLLHARSHACVHARAHAIAQAHSRRAPAHECTMRDASPIRNHVRGTNEPVNPYARPCPAAPVFSNISEHADGKCRVVYADLKVAKDAPH